MKIRNVVGTIALCILALAFSFGQNANLGTWKLNEAKSQIPAGVGKNTTVVYSNTGSDYRVTTEGVAGAARGRHWVYGRTAQPCRRCETPIVAREHGRGNRRTYWCPSCQPEPAEAQP